MAKGRPLMQALRSRVTPTGRWAPPANAHARCVGRELYGKKGGGRMGVIDRFTKASKACK
ncbi:hypothetical protein LCGC14_1376160 [marine sediment metagenome]|uniref:Uncharacterized protein n=1 Tax=marine sediment metagenome TaxID=412755 RepID=A0A0F9MJA5_9ZZZZ